MKPAWIKNIVAIGWDVDGTLYPSSSELSQVIKDNQLNAVQKKTGWKRDKVRKEFDKVYRKLGSTTKTLTHFGAYGPKFFTNLWDTLPLKNYIKKEKRLIQLFDQLNNYRHFVISNSNSLAQIKRKVGFTGLDYRIFELIVSTVKLGAVKPDPKPFLFALDKLKLAPEQVLYIGDRDSTDILGAKGVGMRTCMVWGESKHADISANSVYDVSKLLS